MVPMLNMAKIELQKRNISIFQMDHGDFSLLSFVGFHSLLHARDPKADASQKVLLLIAED